MDENMDTWTMGETIAALRKARGMTQEALANVLGVSNQAVSKWESNASCPDVQLLPRIADEFDVTFDRIFGREPEQPQPLEPVQVVAGLPWDDDGKLRAVCYLGRRLLASEGVFSRSRERSKVDVCITGEVADVQSAFAVHCGDVSGSVKAGDGVTCGSVAGNLTAGDGVECRDVGGNVTAGDSVTCGNVGGNVRAGDSVRCGDVKGDVSAHDRVVCENVGGSVHAPGFQLRT